MHEAGKEAPTRAAAAGAAADSGEAHAHARAEEWRGRLQQAVGRAGGQLGAEWSVDAKIRQSGSSKGACPLMSFIKISIVLSAHACWAARRACSEPPVRCC